jgi:hypothetical protein
VCNNDLNAVDLNSEAIQYIGVLAPYIVRTPLQHGAVGQGKLVDWDLE